MSASAKRVVVVQPHGFCSGVAYAVATAEAALSRYAKPIYCLHEIVHNAQVVADLAARGMRFVATLEEVPPEATLLLSAHGVAPSVHAAARARNLRVIDATCPFVAKVHQEVRRYVAEGFTVVCIGHRLHEEVLGVVGEAPGHVLTVETEDEAQRVCPPDPEKVATVTQTTLSPEMADAIRAVLRRRFPGLRQPARDDICYATRNRQQAVRILAGQVDQVLVLGSPASSNSRRLVEAACAAGGRALLVESREALRALPLDAVSVLGVTSGASTPESLLNDVLADLRARGFTDIACVRAVEEEARRFALPEV